MDKDIADLLKFIDHKLDKQFKAILVTLLGLYSAVALMFFVTIIILY